MYKAEYQYYMQSHYAFKFTSRVTDISVMIMSSEEDAEDVAKFGRVGAMFGSVINGALIEDEEAADPVWKLTGTFMGMGVGAAYNSYKKNQKKEMQVINSSEWCQANWIQSSQPPAPTSTSKVTPVSAVCLIQTGTDCHANNPRPDYFPYHPSPPYAYPQPPPPAQTYQPHTLSFQDQYTPWCDPVASQPDLVHH